MGFVRKIATKLFRQDRRPHGKAGARAYVVGDIHGRLDLLNELLAKIELDIERREKVRTFIVFLGDLIDRGPDSAGVVERLRTYRPANAKPIFLGGNHEEVLLRILRGDFDVLPSWLKFGGTECAESYGIDITELRSQGERAAIKLVQAKIPASHHQFLDGFGDTFRFGDYLFVHAGIRPGLALEDQSRSDLRWIREAFLDDPIEHGFVVVHGHTIVEEVQERPNRIGIDTGAYRTGILTALVIEGAERWYLTADSATAGPTASLDSGC